MGGGLSQPVVLALGSVTFDHLGLVFGALNGFFPKRRPLTNKLSGSELELLSTEKGENSEESCSQSDKMVFTGRICNSFCEMDKDFGAAKSFGTKLEAFRARTLCGKVSFGNPEVSKLGG